MKRVFIKLIMPIFLLFLCLGCSKEDDVQDIFTGGTWWYTYTKFANNSSYMVKFVDNQGELNQQINEARSANISFHCSEGKVDAGTFELKYEEDFLSEGYWEAGASTHEFKASVTEGKKEFKQNKYLESILLSLTNGVKWQGDTNNLFLTYKEGQQMYTVCFVRK